MQEGSPPKSLALTRRQGGQKPDPSLETSYFTSAIDAMIQWQREVINHADPPEAFVHPERILKLLLTNPEIKSRLEILFEEQRRYRARLPESSVARKFYTLGLGLKT